MTLRTRNNILSAQKKNPFGEKIRNDVTGGTNDKYKFTGKERDKESGLDYFGARYYDSEVGRWLSVDPMAAKYPGWSPYNYCLNNPLGLIDPDGMEAFNHIVDDNGDEIKITRKEDKSLEFSSNASEDVKTIANALNLTKTGSAQLDAMIASETDIHLKLSSETKTNGKEIWGGITKPNKKTGNISDSEGNLFYKEATITIYTGSINKIMKNTKEINGGLTFIQAIGIVAGHESVHACDKVEVNADIRYATKYGPDSIRPHQEDKATKVARQIRGEYLK